jgi:hypothetical protein
MGVSARDMLNAIAEGEEDPEKLANFARRTMKKKKEERRTGTRSKRLYQFTSTPYVKNHFRSYRFSY